MPRRAPYLLQWSQPAQIYELFEGENAVSREVISESSAWFAWLHSTSSFGFRSRSGIRYTVRKEHVQRNGPYWYGYRSFQRRTIKRYVGRTNDLTLARLEEVAEQFADAVSSHAEPSSPQPVSRFRPPRLPLALVERARLFAKLDAWRSQKLTLLWAPAGFGKTTLVNSWQSKQPGPSHLAWVSLESTDNHPMRFCHSIISACQSWQRGIGETALARLPQVSVLQPPSISTPLELLLTLFLNDLANRASEGVLILDNYQVIVEQRVHEAVTFLIEHLPAHVHVMVLTRGEPPLPLAQWRARGDMQELSRVDLRFSSEETATFLQKTTASAPSEQTITRIDSLVEGWPAGLRLLVLAGQMTSEGVEHHLSTLDKRQFSDTPLRRQLLDYFVNEVLISQPEQLQLFLLWTSTLPRLTGPLCDVVTNRQNSTALLETLERAGLFLEILDETAPWYRYHPLFAEALRVEASQRLGEKALRTVSERASLWYEQHALVREAIETALRAHDAERAALLLERSGASGQHYELWVLRDWLKEIPDGVLHAHPALCLYAAIALQFQQKQEPVPQKRITELLQRAEEGWRKAGALPWVGLVFALRALRASLQDPSSREAGEHATQALTLLETGETGDDDELRSIILEWRAICLGIAASADLHQGHFEKARKSLLAAISFVQKLTNRQFLNEINRRLAAVSLALGELHQARAYYQQALSGERAPENSEDTARALLGLARISFEWNDLRTSEQQAREALELTEKAGKAGSEQASYLLASCCAARGQDTAASLQAASLLARLQSIPTQDTRELLPDALAFQTRLHLAAGDDLAARRCLTQLEDQARALSFVQQITMNILRVRLQLTWGKDDVVAQLEHLLSIVQERRHPRGQIEIEILLAMVQAARKQKDEARKWLQLALSQAHTESFLRVFLAEGEPLVPVLRSLLPGIREKAPRSFGQTILHILTSSEETLSPPRSALAGPLFEPLSPQERRVLRSLCAGRSNPEIARELVISVNTVKDHVRHLYRKLGVSNRLEAYEAARRLEQF